MLSARNQFKGAIKEVKLGQVMAEGGGHGGQ